MPSTISLSDQQIIIELCDRHENAHHLDPYFNRCVVFGPYFVKYDCHADLYFQYKTQEYLFSQAAGDPNAPRIPEVVVYFSPEKRWAYLVTEYIVPTTPADDAPEAVAKALQWLHGVPVPPGLTLGSVGGGPARHRLFNDFEAPYLFSSTQGSAELHEPGMPLPVSILLTSLNFLLSRALDWVPPANRPEKMNFLDDPLIFTQSDMHSSNFALDRDKKICMFNFQDVGVLPESFARYTLHPGFNPFVGKVGACLGWNNDRSFTSMTRAGAILNTFADPTLGTLTTHLIGLNRHGVLKARR